MSKLPNMRPKIEPLPGNNAWVVRNTDTEDDDVDDLGAGYFLDTEGCWRHYRGKNFRWSLVVHPDRESAEESLAKASLLGEAAYQHLTIDRWGWPDEDDKEAPLEPPSREEAEWWLRVFARRYRIDYDRMVDTLKNGGNWTSFGTSSGPDNLRSDDTQVYLKVLLGEAEGPGSWQEHIHEFGCSC